jgi:hypothetical protein
MHVTIGGRQIKFRSFRSAARRANGGKRAGERRRAGQFGCNRSLWSNSRGNDLGSRARLENRGDAAYFGGSSVA